MNDKTKKKILEAKELYNQLTELKQKYQDTKDMRILDVIIEKEKKFNKLSRNI